MHTQIAPLICLALVLAAPAVAQQKAAAQQKKEPAHPAVASSAPKELATFDDWIAATHGDGSQTVCYALTRAKSSTPSLPGRGEVVLTVTERPTVRDTVAIEAGFDYAKDAAVTVQVDQTGLDFLHPRQRRLRARWQGGGGRVPEAASGRSPARRARRGSR